jgi:hypothetical protein
MAIVQATLSFDGMNISAQVGDIAYYSFNSSQIGGFETSILGDTIELGEIVDINNNPGEYTITVQYDNTIINTNFLQEGTYFISFVKNKKTNTSSLLGYYADVKFTNNSKKKIELFAVNSEVSASSD